MKDYIIGILCFACGVMLIKTIQLQRHVYSLQTPNYTIILRDTVAPARIDSLIKRMKKPVKQRRVKLDSAAISRIEHDIFSTLCGQGVDTSMAKILVAIAKHESNSFNSKLYQTTFNLFGMTYPPKRPTTAIGHTTFLDNGNVRRFCKFESTASATQDIVLYLKHRKYPLNISTPEAMVRLMKSKHYFEASEKLYLRSVKRHLSLLTI